jgi:hypothetical protein
MAIRIYHASGLIVPFAALAVEFEVPDENPKGAPLPVVADDSAPVIDDVRSEIDIPAGIGGLTVPPSDVSVLDAVHPVGRPTRSDTMIYPSRYDAPLAVLTPENACALDTVRLIDAGLFWYCEMSDGVLACTFAIHAPSDWLNVASMSWSEPKKLPLARFDEQPHELSATVSGTVGKPPADPTQLPSPGAFDVR